jgi:Flp pilus assembly protein TadB
LIVLRSPATGGRTLKDMENEKSEKSGPSFGMRVLAAVVLAVAAWFLLKIVIGLVAGIAWFVAVVVALIAVVWAVRTLT